jgi:hypothetical protein
MGPIVARYPDFEIAYTPANMMTLLSCHPPRCFLYAVKWSQFAHLLIV